MPISVEIQNRVLSYWSKLVEDKEYLKLSSQMYFSHPYFAQNRPSEIRLVTEY